jgi:glutaredoxin-like protein NrdH
MTVTVYTQPGCRPCKRVLSKLLEAGIEHRVVDVSVDPKAKGYLNLIGARSVPVVVADNGYEPIVGYQPDLLKYLIETYPKESINALGT